jgi:hypothetical protein
MEKESFSPFEEVVDRYENINSGLMQSRILYAFRSVFRVPKVLISSKFREVMEKILNEDYPSLRCSAARAIFEGRIPGVAKPIETINPDWKKHLEQCFAILDLFETMAYQYLEEELKKSSADAKAEVKGMARTLGTIKLPRLVQFLEQETKNAVKDKKAGPSNGSKVKGKDKAGVIG